MTLNNATFKKWRPRFLSAGLALALGLGLSHGEAARADDITVLYSGGFSASLQAIKPRFEAASGHRLVLIGGPSMGRTPEAIPNRLARGEPADVVVMVGYALDDLARQGRVIPTSRVELADSRIGMAVKAGSPKPDISTVEALTATLLAAKSVGYSESASGVYVQHELFKKLGIDAQLQPKAHLVEKTPVALLVAHGDLELGFQQVSEILPIAGAELVGKIPEAVQSVTVYSAGVATATTHADAARVFVLYLATSPEARAEIARSGMDPK
jgi:molybdate transport system substrate-binding protein